MRGALATDGKGPSHGPHDEVAAAASAAHGDLAGDQIERAGSITPGVESAAAATGSGALIGAVEAHDRYTSRRSEALL